MSSVDIRSTILGCVPLLLLLVTSWVTEAAPTFNPTGDVEENSMVPPTCEVNPVSCATAMTSFNWARSAEILNEKRAVAEVLSHIYLETTGIMVESNISIFRQFDWELDQDLNIDAEQLIGQVFIAVTRAAEILGQIGQLVADKFDHDKFRVVSGLVEFLRSGLREGFVCTQLVHHCDVTATDAVARIDYDEDVDRLRTLISSNIVRRGETIVQHVVYDGLLTTQNLLTRIHQEFVKRATAGAV